MGDGGSVSTSDLENFQMSRGTPLQTVTPHALHSGMLSLRHALPRMFGAQRRAREREGVAEGASCLARMWDGPALFVPSHCMPCKSRPFVDPPRSPPPVGGAVVPTLAPALTGRFVHN